VAELGRRGEFELINEIFAPLASGHELAFGLTDDAALVRPRPGCDLVLTKDALVADVHFLADEAPDLVARKLLRVNLSDLAAMGAEPLGYLLALALPADLGEGWLESFAAGLASDQGEFDLALLGGDMVATPGALTLSLTALGEVEEGRALRRNGARQGDLVYLSGSIGDAALGLLVLKGGLAGLDRQAAGALLDRYRLPRPRLKLGRALGGLVSAASDVSDGLVADLEHICQASGVAALIEAARLPLSPAAEAALALDPALRRRLLAGDDYEILATLAPEGEAAAVAAAAAAGVAFTRIGEIRSGSGVSLRDADGRILEAGAGYRHF
jgi:thiamine-monophosphate kinase